MGGAAAGGFMSMIGNVAGSAIQAGGVTSAAGMSANAYNNYVNYLKSAGVDQNYLNMLNLIMNRQMMTPDIQNRLAAGNLLGMGLGISPSGMTTGTSGTSGTGTGAGAFGALNLPSGVQSDKNRLTLPGTGTTLNYPGFDVSSILGPISASPLGLTGEQQNAFAGSLLDTGVSTGDIRNYLGSGTEMAGDWLRKSIVGQTSGQSGGGVLSALGTNIEELFGLQIPQLVQQMKLSDRTALYNMLESYATGSPASVANAASAGTAGTGLATGQMGTTAQGVGAGMVGSGLASAQGALGLGNIGANTMYGIGNILGKYYGSQTGGNAFSPASGWGGYYQGDPWASATPYGQEF